MAELTRPADADFKPYGGLNLLIWVFSSILNGYLLWQCAHVDEWYWKLLCALAFSVSNNTQFSLVHESVHRAYSHSKPLNEIGGILASIWHPTALIFQRICHLGHHIRNRTDHEIFDMYYAHDNRPLKFIQFYAIFTGFFWLSIPVACFLYLVFPWYYRLATMKGAWAKSADLAMLVPFVNNPKWLRIRAEILFTLVCQIALFKFLDLNFASWILCYWTYGMNWGALQYADHAWSVRDIRNGAWNLRVLPITRWFFLNYHYHLVHHRFPTLPWHSLPKYVDPKEPQPVFWKIYFEMWKGPRLVTDPPPKAIEKELMEMLR